jgi:phospholipid N-methyltransferase
VITQALLEHGIPHKQIVVIEKSENMVVFLKEKFPRIRVLCGDAGSLSELLGKDASRVKAIVSSLPFRTLSFKTIRQISREIDQILSKHGRFIQFTYALHSKVTLLPSRFQRVKSKIVWHNLPPARVDVFEV